MRSHLHTKIQPMHDDHKPQSLLLDDRAPPTVSDADLEQMYKLLYAYRFGSISFLELLDKFEEILHIGAS
jgi:hypothetical protein